MLKAVLIIFLFLNYKVVLVKDNFIEDIRISDKNKKHESRIVLELNNRIPYSVFMLDNEPRLVIDLEANLSFIDLPRCISAADVAPSFCCRIY